MGSGHVWLGAWGNYTTIALQLSLSVWQKGIMGFALFKRDEILNS